MSGGPTIVSLLQHPKNDNKTTIITTTTNNRSR